jgi:hypothetical protein
MKSEYNESSNFIYWSQSDKWKGFFKVAWLIVKDIPNTSFKSLTNKLNDCKPVPSSRDTQEVHNTVAQEMLKIYKEHKYTSSILDDFEYYNYKENMKMEFVNNGSIYNTYSPHSEIINKDLHYKKDTNDIINN